MKVRKLETRSCPRCGTPFEAWPSQPKVYCSQACSWASNARNLNLKPKLCRTCHVEFKPLSARQQWCFTCSDGGNHARQAMLRRYNLSLREWQEMQARYNGQCWICRDRPATNVDHDHSSGTVRGALCRVCNMVLHYVERPGWWDAATGYLDESRARH